MPLIIKKITSDLKPRNILAGWPLELPLIFLGSSKSRFFVLALKGKTVPATSLLTKKVHVQKENHKYNLPFTCGFLGALSYDFCTSCEAKSNQSLVVEVNRSLIWDKSNNEMFLCENFLEPEKDHGHWTFDIPYNRLSSFFSHITLASLTLASSLDHDAYKEMCQKAQSMIRQGRFYQINLLRYFDVTINGPIRGLSLSVFDKGGSYACCFCLPSVSLFSFSPEQFCQVTKIGKEALCTTSPIKGTIQRPSTELEAKKMRRELLTSKKNEAELNMITELMRNDLGELAKPGSVKVLSKKKIFAFDHIYHLKSKIQALLRKDLCFADFFAKLAPAGSITGAPKIEAQKAIFEFEQRGRGYFMGNAFYFDPFQGNFDSSVLIRTVVTKPDSQELEFAAGSGIVLNSTPEEEWQEILAKTRILAP